MKLSNLLERDLKIVEKRKMFFLIPAIVVVLAIIAGIIYGFAASSAINFGMDFTGGYTINLNLSTKLTDENYDDYVKQIENVFNELKDDEGESYNVKVSSTQLQGKDESASIYIKYQSVKGEKGADIQDLMENEINKKLISALNELYKITPLSASYSGGVVSVTYSEIISEPMLNSIKDNLAVFSAENAIAINLDNVVISTDKKVVLVTASEDIQLKFNALKSAMTISDEFSGRAVQGDIISATVSSELLTDAILAVALAVTLMLVYIAFRFEVSSGVAAILALLHDLIIMFAFVVIFHVEINATFIAALITILGYSINNTIIIFDRIRENTKMLKYKNASPVLLANTSVRETLLRSINTTITTLITITAVAVIGVPAIRTFAFPIIVGLLAGTYSSIFISPSIWASWKIYVQNKNGTAKEKISKPIETKTETEIQ